MSKRPVALIVYNDWRTKHSGVASFVRYMQALCERDDIDFRIVEVADLSRPGACSPRPTGALRSGVAHFRRKWAGSTRRNESEEMPRGRTRATSRDRSSRLLAPRLFLGYVRTLLANVAMLRKFRGELKNRVLVTNEFGCETFPIALRLCFPFRTIVAIAHTHPGQGTNANHPVKRMIERLCNRSVNRVVCNSRSVREEWARKLGRPTDDWQVIYYGVEEPDATMPDAYPERSGAVDFVCVSRIVGWKGHNELLQAWQGAEGQCKVPIRLIIVGGGSALGETVEFARGLGLNVLESLGGTPLTLALSPEGRGNRATTSTSDTSPLGGEVEPSPRGSGEGQYAGSADVIFLGDRPSGATYFNGGDVGVLLSTEPEAFGQVVVEAMSRKMPVLVSNKGGISEAAGDDDAGFLVDPHDTQRVADGICRLAENSELRAEMGGHGYERWRCMFTVPRMLADYGEYFGKLADE